MFEFQSGLPAEQAHTRLRESLQALQHAEKNSVLWFDEIRRRRLYRALGYSSIHAYAISELGFSKSRCSQFIRLTESLERLPKLRESVAKGEVAWTKAREVVKVASPRNEERWVAEAKRSSRRELEAKVKISREHAVSERRSDPGQASLLDDADVAKKVGSRPAPNLTCEAPVAVSLRFTPEQFASYEALVEQLRKRRMPADLPANKAPSGREGLLLAGLAALLNSIALKHQDASHVPTMNDAARARVSVHENPRTDSPIKTRTDEFPRGNQDTQERVKRGRDLNAVPGPAFQIVVHKCEDCERANVVSSRGDLALSKPTLDRIECDSRTLRPGKRNKASISPGLRNRVLARDGHRCRASGCGSTRFLEVHHVRSRAAGGGNEPENLITPCASCHQLLHEMSAMGRTPSACIGTGVSTVLNGEAVAPDPI